MNPVLRTTLWIGAGLALIAAAAALVLLWLLFGAAHGGVDIRINGQPLALHDLPLWHDWQGALGAGGFMLAALVLLLCVPVLLLLVLGALAGAAAVAGVLLAVALVALLALSPLWLVLLLVWLNVRRRPAPAATRQP